jgi:predicted dehydrogenase
MRHLSGDPQWCFARVTHQGKPLAREHIRDGAEGIGPLGGDTLTASYGFGPGVIGTFGSLPARHGVGARFALHVYGTKGAISLGTGTLPPAYLLEDPSWTLFQNGGRWLPITSAGVDRPEPLADASHRYGNTLIVADLIRSVESGGEPLDSVVDGRAAIEMIMAVYESHRQKAPVALPLRERRHPLSLL